MKYLSLIIIQLLLACSTPKSGPSAITPEPKLSDSQGKPAFVEFTQVKMLHQPPPPPYPIDAKLSHTEGTVIVEIVVNPKGEVESAKALSGPPELLEYAQSWVLKWKFAPALLDGRPQYARFKLTMPFRLK